MTNEQAKREAKKRYGNRAYLRNSGYFSSPERREKARAQYTEANLEIQAIDKEIRERLAELDWLQDLKKRKAELEKTRSTAQGEMMFRRFAVGKTNSMFNEILGEGDTWEQAFEAADKNR